MNIKRLLSMLLMAVMVVTTCAPVGISEEYTGEPIVEATEEPAIEATDEPVVEATDEPVVEATEEPVAEATQEPVVDIPVEFVPGYAEYAEGTRIYENENFSGEYETIASDGVVYVAEKIDGREGYGVYYVTMTETAADEGEEAVIEYELAFGYVKAEEEIYSEEKANSYIRNADRNAIAVPGTDGYVLCAIELETETEEPAKEIEMFNEEAVEVVSDAPAAAVIVNQTTEIVAEVGDTVSMTVEATGAASYKWQYSRDGGETWGNLNWDGAKTATMTGSLTEARMSFWFRCVITGEDGNEVTTEIIKIKSPAGPAVIVKQPADAEGAVGDTISFTVEATGAAGYKWQYSRDNGETWGNLNWEGAKTATMTGALTEARMSFWFRCVITGEDGNEVVTDTVKIKSPAGPAVIVKQPADAEGAVGDTVTFTVEATGAAGYKWQYSRDNGETWGNLNWDGAKTATMTGALTEARMGFWFRCVITGEDGNEVVTDTVKIKSPAGPAVIVKQPADAEGAVGDTISFTVEATGAAGYKWQFSRDNGETWSNLNWDGAKTATMTGEVNESRAKFLYRCVITGEDGNEVITDTVKINSPAGPAVIVKQPEDIDAQVGDTISLTVEATGAVSYKWQYSRDNGETWGNLNWDGAKTATMTGTLTEARLSFQFRCVITGADGNEVITNVVSVKSAVAPNPAVIVTEPDDVNAEIGDTISFTVEATGAAGYKWQFSNDDGSTWSNLNWEGAKTATMTGAVNASRAKFLYRCVITGEDGNTVITRTVRIITPANPAVITAHPADVVAEVDDTVTFTVEATGAASYKWQYSRDNGETWSNLNWDGAKTATMTGVVTEARKAFLFRCVVTGEDGNEVISNTAQIVGHVQIVTEPSDAVAEIGDTATFTVEATGAASYKWQYSRDNGETWSNLNWDGAKTATMTGLVTEARMAFLIRCVVTGVDQNVLYTKTVKIVSPAEPVEIITQPCDAEANVGDTVVFTVEATNAASYKWQFSNDVGETWSNLNWESAKTDTLTGEVNASRAKFLYRCVITGEDGNTYITNVVQILPVWRDAPVIEAAEQTANGEVTVTWSHNGADAYEVRMLVGEEWIAVALVEEFSAVIGDLEAGEYQFAVAAAKVEGESVAEYGDVSESVAVTVLPDAFEIDGVVYTEVEGGIEITLYKGDSAEVVIPETIEGMTVVRVGASAFEGNTNITYIDLPDTIEVIGARAFADCINLSTME